MSTPSTASPDGADVVRWSEQLADVMDQAALNFANEQELREHVHGTITAAISSLYGLGIAASAGEFNTKTSGARSPVDRLYGGVVVEWEWQMAPARREHGARQALDYLENVRTHHPAADIYTAVVCDGRQWGFLRQDPRDVAADLFSDSGPETASEHFVWVANSPAACRQFLELIGSHRKSPITSRTLTTRFGPASTIASRLVTVLGQSMAGRLPADRADTLFREWHRALEVVYGDLSASDGELAEEIQGAYRTPVRRPLGELLFVVHTYFALVGRVMAVELLAVASGALEDAPSSWRGLDNSELLTKLRGLEVGKLPGDLTIENLFEADLFSWWADRAESNNDLLDAIRALVKEVADLAFPQIAFGPRRSGDVLRDLYQALVPRKLRKALGEFLTPHWLADACLSRLREQGADLDNGRVLDPTCGTGTFIVPVLTERLRRLVRTQDGVSPAEVQAVLDSVMGIDLNPVAVTAARVNFVLALGDLANVGPLRLPIWRADSLVAPVARLRQTTVGPVAGISHSVLATSLDEPFTIPLSLTSAHQIALLRVMIEAALAGLAHSGGTAADVVRSAEEFEQAFALEFGPDGREPIDGVKFADDATVATNLFGQIADLALKGQDGIWARLIENAYAPLFVGTFDVVVGNPPWLTWTKLPADWRQRSEELWRRYGLWYTPAEAGDSFSFQSGDLATLVFAASLARYAKPGAYVGLLTPAALINADPGGRAFRQFHLRPDPRDVAKYETATDVEFGAVWVDDWTRVMPFSPDAANKPIFLIARRGRYQSAQTLGAVWQRLDGAKIDRGSWRATKPLLREALGDFAPIDADVPTSAWRFQDFARPLLIKGGHNNYVFGKGLDTRGANGVYLVHISRPQPVKGNRKATVQVENRPEEGRNDAVEVTKGRVETDLVYPMLRGKDVTHWVANPVTYFVLPHNPEDLDKPLATSLFRRDYPQTLDWFKRHRSVLAARKTPPTRSWDMSGTGDDWCRVDGALQHMDSSNIVVVREFAHRPAAALVTKRIDFDLGGRSVAPLIDHKLMFCAVSSRDEALYLVAMINSTPMQDLLESFVNSIAVSPKSMQRLPIPDYDPANTDMKRLTDLAGDVVAASDPVQRAGELAPDMDAAVLAVIAARSDYQPQPKKVARRRVTAVAPSTAEDQRLF